MDDEAQENLEREEMSARRKALEDPDPYDARGDEF